MQDMKFKKGEIFWEGKIKIVYVEDGEDFVVQVNSEEFDLDSLSETMDFIEKEFGRGFRETVKMMMVGLLERLKVDVLFVDVEG